MWKVPYTIPNVGDLQTDVVGRLNLIDLIQVRDLGRCVMLMLMRHKDDVMIDIIVSPEDTVGMSIEAASSTLSISASTGIVEKWVEFVKEALPF